MENKTDNDILSKPITYIDFSYSKPVITMQDLMREVHEPGFDLRQLSHDVSTFKNELDYIKFDMGIKYNPPIAEMQASCTRINEKIDGYSSHKKKPEVMRKHSYIEINRMFKTDFKDLVRDNPDMADEKKFINKFMDVYTDVRSQDMPETRNTHMNGYPITSDDIVRLNHHLDLFELNCDYFSKVRENPNIAITDKSVESLADYSHGSLKTNIEQCMGSLDEKKFKDTYNVASNYKSLLETVPMTEENINTFIANYRHDMNESITKEKYYPVVTISNLKYAKSLTNFAYSDSEHLDDSYCILANNIVQFRNETAVMEQRAGTGTFSKAVNEILQKHGLVDESDRLKDMETISCSDYSNALSEIIDSYEEHNLSMPELYPMDDKDFVTKLKQPSVEPNLIINHLQQIQPQNQSHNQNKNKDNMEI